MLLRGREGKRERDRERERERGMETSKKVLCSVTRKKVPNIYKSCPKMISLQKCLRNVGDLSKLDVAKGFKKLPKVQ